MDEMSLSGRFGQGNPGIVGVSLMFIINETLFITLKRRDIVWSS